MVTEGYLKFTGKYSDLKSMGYTFQRMFAGNYMAWHKNGMFIYKKGAEITKGDVDLFKLVTLLRTGQPVRVSDSGIIFFVLYHADNSYEYLPVTPENRELYKQDIDKDSDSYYSTVHVSDKILDLLRELNYLGWYEPVEYPPEIYLTS